MWIDEVIWFIESLTFWDVVAYFWPFFFIDMLRYLAADIIILIYYLPKSYFAREDRLDARRKLFTERPLISVIVPGKNEGKYIPKLVESLKLQTYNHYELVIVDDGSDDNTAEICRRMEQDGHIDCFVRNEVRGGKASAANTALRYSKGKYILHIDADSHLADDTIETIILPFIMDEQIGAVGGDVRVANGRDNITTSLQSIEYLKSITTGRTIASSLGILRIISGAHGAFRRDVLQRIQGWDVGPGLDGDITLKIRKLGLKVVHEPRAVCYTNVPVSMIKLAKQRYRWDRSLIRFRVRKHQDVLKRSKSFNVANFFASSENIFFNLILNFKWWIYLLQMVIFNLEWIGYIFFINYILYTSANILQFLVATVLVGESFDRRHYLLYLFLPLMPLYYGIYLRIVRTYAYIMEFFHKVSYWDSWNPWKVSKIAKREKL